MKEIIIDGVNIAGCEHSYMVSNKPYCGIDSECVYNNCENYPDCYYKQLKRKEQENAELKAENEIARQAAKDFVEINEAYMKYED